MKITLAPPGGMSLLLLTAALTTGALPCPAVVIWNGPLTTFTKPSNADWTLPQHQDRITDNVWLTRADIRGLFNIRVENGYSPTSPADTEWALGTLDQWDTLEYRPWMQAAAGNPPDLVGRDMVLHLITDDVYIGVRFLSWADGISAPGGAFAYERTTVPEPRAAAALALAALAWAFGGRYLRAPAGRLRSAGSKSGTLKQ